MKLKLVEHNLVLLPGLDGTGYLFTPLVSALPSEYSVHIVAYPNDRRLTFNQLLPRIRQNMPWDKPFTLIAESYAGHLALALAAAQPEHIHAIVMVNAFVTNPLVGWLKWLLPMIREGWFKIGQPSASFWRRYVLGPHDSPMLAEAWTDAIRSLRPEVLVYRIRQVLSQDSRLLLQNCQKPMLYLMGTQDRLVGRRGWLTMCRYQPGMKLATLEGPHLLLQSNPRKAIAALEVFLKSIKPATQTSRATEPLLASAHSVW